MLPLTLPMHGAFAHPPEALNEEGFAAMAKAALDAKELKNQQALSRPQSNDATNEGGAYGSDNENHCRSAVALPVHRRRASVMPASTTGVALHRVEDFPFLDWGSDVKAIDLPRTDFLGGVAITPVQDRKLVKLGLIAARAVVCMQHPDIVVPELLLADYSSAGSGCVLMCEEKSRFGNLGVQPDIAPRQRERILEAIAMEFNLDLSQFLLQVPAPCNLYAVDVWDTIVVRSHISGASRVLKRARDKKKKQGTATVPEVAVTTAVAEGDDEGDDEEDEEKPEDGEGEPVLVDASPQQLEGDVADEPQTSIIESMLKTSRVQPLQLLRKLLNTTEDPEGPLDATFPNKKKISQRFVTGVTNTTHLLPTIYPIGVRTFSAFLVRRLRPEFLRDYGGAPLVSSACYASCPVGRANRAKINSFHATLHLFNVVIPSCAASLNAEPTTLQGEALCNRLHMYGVNLRFLGWLLPWVTKPDVARAILTEITARSYKRVEEKRDRERHARLTKALQDAAQLRSAAAGDGLPSVSDDEDDGDVEFAELTRIAVNKFYPPHLWVPLPKFLPSEMKLLSRMHSRYGVVVDVLEAWGNDPEEDAAERRAMGLHNPNGAVPLDDEGQAGTTDNIVAAFAAGGKDGDAHCDLWIPTVVDGIDFGLELDASSCPPTPHVEAAYEFDTVLHPSVIDSAQVERRILDLVRRQRFVFLPGRFPAVARESYLAECSSSGMHLYFQFLQASLLRRLESNPVGCTTGALSPLEPAAVCDGTVACTDVSKRAAAARCLFGTDLERMQGQSPRLYPLLQALGLTAFALYPYESCVTSSSSGAMFLEHAVALMLSHLPGHSSNVAKERSGGTRSSTAVVTDAPFWACAALLAQGKFFYATEHDDGCIARCNEGLQIVLNPRQRVQLLLTQLAAQSRKAIQAAAVARARAPMSYQLSGDWEDDDDFDRYSESSPLFGGSNSNPTDPSIASNASNAVQPLILDVLRYLPTALPPKHPSRELLYRGLLYTLEAFIDREMINSTMHLLSPSNSSQSSTMRQLANNLSIAEGSMKDELMQVVVERNFAGNGVPFEVLGCLKAQRDAFMAACPATPHFVSPNATRFTFEDSKFPDAVATMAAALPLDGAGGQEGGDSQLAANDAMTLLDAFLGTDREGLRQLEDKKIIVFTCHVGQTSIAYETTRNIIEMRKLNANSVGACATSRSTIVLPDGKKGTPPTEGLDLDGTDSSSNATLQGTGRQLGVHATLWASDRRQSRGGGQVPDLPLCSLLPIVIRCRLCQPYDNKFLQRALPNVSDANLRLLSHNPRIVLILDGYNPCISNTATDFHNFLHWTCKKVILVGTKTLERMSPTEFAKAIFSSARAPSAIVASAVGYATMPLSQQHIFKALQRYELSRWDNTTVTYRNPLLLVRHALPCVAMRWHLLRVCAPRLVQLMADPILTTCVGAAVPLMMLPAATVERGSAFRRRFTVVEVLDCVVYTQFLVFEQDARKHPDMILYAMTMATLMAQTNSTTVRFDQQAAGCLHCLPIKLVDDGAEVAFLHPLFIAYFLSVRSVLEVLDAEGISNKGGVGIFDTVFATEMFTKELLGILRKSSLNKSKSALAARALSGFLQQRDKSQGTLLKAMSKFSEGKRKRSLTGTEWLTRKEVSIESDAYLIDLLAERCLTVPAFQSALLAHGLQREAPADAKAIVPNALTILARARIPLSGRSLRGIDMSSANLSNVSAIAVDARGTKWFGSTARNANVSFSDFTSANMKLMDIGSEPKLSLVHKHATITAAAFAPQEHDVMFTGDEAGHLTRWRIDTGLAEQSVRLAVPVARLALNTTGSLIAVTCAETNPTIEIRETQTLHRVAMLVDGHSARVTAVKFFGRTQILTTGFDWQILAWELPTDIADAYEVAPPPEAGGEGHGSRSNSYVGSDDGTTLTMPRVDRQVSPKRVHRLEPLHATRVKPSSPSRRHQTGSLTLRSRMLPADVINATKVWSTKQPQYHRGGRSPRKVMSITSDTIADTLQPNGGTHPASGEAGTAVGWFNVCPSRVVREHHVHVTALDANVVASLYAFLGGDGAGMIVPLDVKTSREKAPTLFQCQEVRGASSIKFTDDGQKLAIPTNRGVCLLDALTGRRLMTLAFPFNASNISQCIDISYDGSMLAAACDRHVCVWDAITGSVLVETKPFATSSVADATAGAPGGGSEMPSLANVSCTGFTRKGKALLTTYWGGGVKVTPIVFSERRDQILSEVQSDFVPTSEYRWLFLVNRGAHAVGIGFNGSVEAVDVSTGTHLGNCGRVQDDCTHAAGDYNSDFVAVACPPLIRLFTAFRRLPPLLFPTGTRQLTSIAFAPPSAKSGIATGGSAAATMAMPLLLGCGADRIVRVWSCEMGSLMCVVPFDATIMHLAQGRHRLLALTGSASGRSLSIATMETTLFPPMEKKKGGGGGKLFVNGQGEMILRLQRMVFMCVRRRYQRHHHYGNVLELLSAAVLPYLRRHVDVQLRQSSAVVRFPNKDSLVRCALGGPGDRIAAVSFDQTLSLWNVDTQTTHIRTQQVHQGPITCVNVSPDTTTWWPETAGANTKRSAVECLVATSCADGTTMVTVVKTGQRLVSICPSNMRAAWCTVFVRRGWCGVDPPSAAATHGLNDHQGQCHHLLTCGSDRILRKWNLAGALCVIGTRHPIASLSQLQLTQWLTTNGLGALTALLAGKLGSDLMDMQPSEVVQTLLPLLTAIRSPHTKTRRSTMVGGAGGLLPALLRRNSSSLRARSPFADSPTKRLSADSPPRLIGLQSHRHSSTTPNESGVATTQDLELLQGALRRARERSYETIDSLALDDAELTAEQFDVLTPEQLAAFFEYHSTQQLPASAILASVSPLLMDRRISGEALRRARTLSELRSVLQGPSLTCEDMAKSLFHEVTIVRNSRLKASFAEKSFAEIVLFSRTKSPAVQFLFQVVGLTGKELLDRTQFSNQTIIFCTECGRKIADARMTCPVRRGNHTHLTPQLDGESVVGMSRLTNTFREHINSLVDAMFDVIRRFPEKVRFSCGMWWHPLLQDPGLVSVLHFNVPQLTATTTTVINTATISITSTEKSHPRMVVIEEQHPKLLQKLAGVASTIGTAARMARLSFPTPPGWKRSAEAHFSGGDSSVLGRSNNNNNINSSDLNTSFASRGSGGGTSSVGSVTKYSFGDHVQTVHPCMPTAVGSYHAEEIQTTVTVVDRLTSVLSASIPPLEAPKAHHRLRRTAGIGQDATLDGPGDATKPQLATFSIHSDGSHSNIMRADVKDIVQAAIARGSSTIRILVVAETVPDAARDLSTAACRPVLTVNYYDENVLCACKSRCVWFPPKATTASTLAATQNPSSALATPPSHLGGTKATASDTPIPMGEGYLPPPTFHANSPAHQTPQSLFHTKDPYAATYHSGMVMCDRFCNIHSQCQGHKCPSTSHACRRAPYMIWETREAKGGAFYRVHLNGVSNLSNSNAAHIRDHSRPVDVKDDDRVIQRKVAILCASSGARMAADTTPTAVTPPAGGGGGMVTPHDTTVALPSVIASTADFQATPAPISLLLPPSQRMLSTPLSPPGGLGQDSSPLRRKTVTITSFESELQERGLQ